MVGREHDERTDQPFQTEPNASMMYYYDDGTGVQVYPVEEAVLKSILSAKCKSLNRWGRKTCYNAKL